VYEIVITESYRKRALKFFKKHPELKDKYKKTFMLLRIDPFHKVLDCKKMKGHSELYRIRLTANTRIVIEIVFKKTQIIPVDINTRERIY
jgi:mRNA-degrading endonuclease RelE of RelBE toxin-antitoxin system